MHQRLQVTGVAFIRALLGKASASSKFPGGHNKRPDQTRAFHALVNMESGAWHSGVLHFLYESLGWLAFLAWSLSFYPQALLNYERKRCRNTTSQVASTNA